jgi:hypothetical protein
MNLYQVSSDQLYTWSDTYEEEIRFRSPQTPASTAAPTAAAGRHSARVADRALQTLRQAWLQMRQRSWPRPQILFVSKLPGVAPANGLCAAGRLRPDQGVCGQLPAGSRYPRGNIRDQPRTAAPPRSALRTGYGSCFHLAQPIVRRAIGRRNIGQYARRVARQRATSFDYCGGSR